MFTAYIIKKRYMLIIDGHDVYEIVVGLLASAALVLMNAENFGSPTEDTYSFVISIIIFLIAFIGTRKYKANPILMIIACGIAGLLLY